MLGIWEVVLIIAVLVIVSEFVVRIVKIGTKYSENIERIKHGYPTLNGDTPIGHVEPESDTHSDFKGTSLNTN